VFVTLNYNGYKIKLNCLAKESIIYRFVQNYDMPIKKSISGMRGTIGGVPGENLTPIDVVEMTAAYGQWLLESGAENKVVVGRDGRISGQIVSDLAINTLLSLGINVVNLGYSTTPTVEMAVTRFNAGGGIIFTASHNPKEWNALKMLNSDGEFVNQSVGERILELVDKREFNFAHIDELGKLSTDETSIDFHINEIFKLPYVSVDRIKSRKFKVVVDCINSTGAIALPPLLDQLNCEYILINAEVTGDFNHNPEPVPSNLIELSDKVKMTNSDIGIAVDPDVDRLVLICEDGSMFSEEYTIVAVSDYVLMHKPGATVSNLSSTRALADVSTRHGQSYYASAVGEVNVVNKMKEVNASIGGEGNGGVILPDLHYGRDALVGIVLIMNHLIDTGMTMSELKHSYPNYEIIKQKIDLNPDTNVKNLLNIVKNKYLSERLNEEDGLKIDFSNGWVHLRESNTEPIIRIIAEAKTKDEAEKLIEPILKLINE
jgi:phosphomannomutase